MKKIGIGIIFLLLLCTVLYTLMQGPLGKRLVENSLKSALEKSGYQVHIDAIEGTLPQKIDLKGVSIQGDGVDVRVEKIHLRPVLWRLLKREIAFNNIDAKQIAINQYRPFDFSGKARFSKGRFFAKGTIDEWKLLLRYLPVKKQAYFSISRPTMAATGLIRFTPHLASQIAIRSDFVKGQIVIQQKEDEYLASAKWQLVEHPLKGAAEGVFHARNLKGSVTSPLAKGAFDLTFEPSGLVTGTTDVSVENLQSLFLFDLYGKLNASAIWDAPNGVQGVHFDAIIDDLYYKDLFAKTVSLYSDLVNPFEEVQGLLDFQAENLKYKHLQLESASFQTEIGQNSFPYQLFVEGSLRSPFELRSQGKIRKAWTVDVDRLSGQIANSPFALSSPIELIWEEEEKIWSAKKVFLNIGNGSIELDFERKQNFGKTELSFKQVPIEFLSFNPLEVPIEGDLNLDLKMEENNGELKGTFSGQTRQSLPLLSEGSFEGSFQNELLKGQGKWTSAETPLFNFDVSIPMALSFFKTELLTHKSASGSFTIDLRVEEILDYFDLGPHHLKGKLEGKLSFKNTLYRPLVDGNFTFTDGHYENYFTGTEFTQIEAQILGQNNDLLLQTLSMKDLPGDGKLIAKGALHLLESDLYPFEIDMEIDNLQLTEIDLVKATADGQVHIEGNALSALVQGAISVKECELSIPDRIPSTLPHLDVVYRNPIHPIDHPTQKGRPYPMRLDLKVNTPTEVLISGRGLNSKWRGDFHLGGTLTDLSTQGTLELIEGEFKFSSRSFKLTEGLLQFSGIEHQMPYLNLAGQMETKGIVITARLKGPLNNPQITLLSSPALPLSSIMSYLLFGQDISEIGGFQALQLANSLASLVGTSPDVMEKTRKSLGVDRLQVVSEPIEGGEERIALQVGKYVSKGVLVSFSQGVDESSTNISVEIELKNNFIFQIESDQRQEQGRFTLKWNLNY